MKKKWLPLLTMLAACAGLHKPATAAVLLDDTWADGSRGETSLPVESAWYASSAGGTPTLSASPAALTGNVRMFETNAGSRLWITHFTEPGAPVELGVGETLKATLVFTPVGVNNASTSRGLRFGLFNFSEPGASRVGADGFSTGDGAGAPGANVTGYIINMNFAQAFGIANPLQIMKRTDLVTNNLMGRLQAYTSLGSGGGAAGSAGFRDGVTYTLEFAVKRLESSAEISARFSDGAGWSIAHTVTDSTAPNIRFDGFGMRPNSVADTADAFTFSRFKVELVPFALRIRSITYDPLQAGATVTWDAIVGRFYQIEARGTLAPDSSWLPIGQVTASASVESFVDPDAVFEPQRFYQVVEVVPAFLR
ncbi:MAG TPA: hypothetical protein VNO52_16005 [Methylomirabilota bacterium]|nr:hypothetical protein [Methylomirabilota bacterium]